MPMSGATGRLELPLDPSWENDTNAYVDSLLSFVTQSTIFQNLCGGVHVLDFLTRTPDVYASVLPQEWRAWFEEVDVHDLLHVLLRTQTESVLKGREMHGEDGKPLSEAPRSLLEYIHQVRIHCLARQFTPGARLGANESGVARKHAETHTPMARHVLVGMKPKKIHEVSHFAAFVSELSSIVQSLDSQTPLEGNAREQNPLKLVDFGSGQNYLGRALASPPYSQQIIAIERHHHNVDGARGLDVHAKLAKKEKVLRNKKQWKLQLAALANDQANGVLTPPPSDVDPDMQVNIPREAILEISSQQACIDQLAEAAQDSSSQKGSMTHINHEITSGELESIVYADSVDSTEPRCPLMTISLHSCGNLTHHALRSIENPSVRCVAAIGCCYNLLTERLGPPTYKHPQLHRSLHPRLVATSTAYDACGFPMSRRLEEYQWTTPPRDGITLASSVSNQSEQQQQAQGVRMNITARMMAVQAPSNWGREDSEMFFTRHFYRALLQKILLDCGVVKQATGMAESMNKIDGNSLSGKDDSGTPLIVGNLKKSAFESFDAYVHAALSKLVAVDEADRTKTDLSNNRGLSIAERTAHLTPEIIKKYEAEYGYRRKHLSVMWSLMAFSAAVVESLIAVDRWLWLKEQDCIEQAWVQTVFDYSISPRNLCVIGIKNKDS